MVSNSLWSTAWAAGWEQQQQQFATAYKSAMLAGGMLVTSTSYLRHRSRDGSRVLVYFASPAGTQRPWACEVDSYIQPQQPSAPAAGGQVAEGPLAAPATAVEVSADGGGRSEGAGGSVSGSSSSRSTVCFALLRVFKTKVPRNEPDLGDQVLEARVGDFERGGSLYAVPLHLIHCPLHACTHVRERADGSGVEWLVFVPVEMRSKRVGFKEPQV